MVETVTKYVARNGSEFLTAQEAVDHEQLITDAGEAESLIQYVAVGEPDDIGVQNTPEAITAFNSAFEALLRKYTTREFVDAWHNNPRGRIQRMLSEAGTPATRVLWPVYYACVMKVGKDGKTYGQHFHADQTYQGAGNGVV